MMRLQLLVLGTLLALSADARAEQASFAASAAAQLRVVGEAGAPNAQVGPPDFGDDSHLELRARDFRAGEVRGHLVYLRFNLSELGGAQAQSATLTLHKTGGDTLAPERVSIFGLLEATDNTEQDWQPNTLRSVGAEIDLSMFRDDVASLGVSPVVPARVVDFSQSEQAFEDNVRLRSGAIPSGALVRFLQSRIDHGGNVTFLVAMPSQGADSDKQVLLASPAHPDPALRPTLELVYSEAPLPPPAPVGLALANAPVAGLPAATLAWAPVGGAQRYRVYRREASLAEPVALGTVVAPQFTDRRLRSGQEYFYAVSVETEAGVSALSAEVAIVVAEPPATFPAQPAHVRLAPERVAQLKVEGTAGAPTLWVGDPGDAIELRARDFAQGAVRGHLSYLRFDLRQLGPARAASAELTLHQTGGDSLTRGRVAVFGLLDGPASTPQAWGTGPWFSPGEEFDLSLFEDNVASEGEVPLRRELLAELPLEEDPIGRTLKLRSEPLRAFLQSRLESGGLATLLIAMPSQGAENDKQILFASPAASDPALRPTLALEVVGAALPRPPQGLALAEVRTGAAPEVTLHWEPVAGALRYRVLRRSGGQPPVAVGDTTAPRWVDSRVELLQTYRYSVAVETPAGPSPRSREREVTVVDPNGLTPATPAPFALVARDGDGVALDWGESDGSLLYEVLRSKQTDAGFERAALTPASEYVDRDRLEPYQTYHYYVRALGAGGRSRLSSVLEVGPRFAGGRAPRRPRALRQAGRSSHSVNLAWQPSEGAEAYYVSRSTTRHAGYRRVGVLTTPHATDEFAVYPDQTYYYRVKAAGAGGFSKFSRVVRVEPLLSGRRQMERLSRAPVAVRTEEGVFVAWRLLGTDPPDAAFNLYRDGRRINRRPLRGATNTTDRHGSVDSVYEVRLISGDEEQAVGAQASVLPENFWSVPLSVPSGGETRDGESYTYSANDATVGDLDGDGRYEIVLKWYPSNAKDNSQAGLTGNTLIDAYQLTGERLWRIDLGHNIRSGAHYTQMMVYDFDSDGKAELIVKTADGTKDAQGRVVGDPEADYRNGDGYVLEGPEYLSVFSGQSGRIVDTVDYLPPRGDVNLWGDTYGNRVDRFLAGVAYLDGVRPSYVAARGQYRGQGGTDGRTVIAAFDFSAQKLTQRWVFDSLEEGKQWAGQGHHQLSVGDADADGRDEILYGGMVVDDDGSGLYSTLLGTGDALHFGDFDPGRPGLEVFSVKEEFDAAVHVEFREASTGALIWGQNNGRDTGRGLIADIDPLLRGAEAWGAVQRGGAFVPEVWTARGRALESGQPSINFATWWDGDLLRELTDTTSIRKWDPATESEFPLVVAEGTASNNGTKANSCLQADLLGDWREEVVFRTEDSSALRIYTTTEPTEHRITTLMHDPMYRLAVAWQNNGYNQPPHPSFYIGHNMPAPSLPRLFVEPRPELLGRQLGPATYANEVVVELQVNLARGLANEYRLNGGAWRPYQRALSLRRAGDYAVEFRTLGSDDAVLATSTTRLAVKRRRSRSRSRASAHKRRREPRRRRSR